MATFESRWPIFDGFYLHHYLFLQQGLPGSDGLSGSNGEGGPEVCLSLALPFEPLCVTQILLSIYFV